MEKKIEPFKIRVNSEQAKVVRERMKPYILSDNVPDGYPFDNKKNSCIHYFDNSLYMVPDIGGIITQEITFGYFLNMFPETREGRKIIGYCIKPEFENKSGSIAKSLNIVLKSPDIKSVWMYVGSTTHIDAKELQVLNIWFDPAYEEEKPEKKAFTIGISTMIAEKGSEKVTSEGITYSIEELKDSVMEMESRVKKETKGIEELKEVIKFIQK